MQAATILWQSFICSFLCPAIHRQQEEGCRGSELGGERRPWRIMPSPGARRALIATKQYDEARAALNRLIEMEPSKEDPEGFKKDQDAAREELKSIARK